ncbi:MAG: sigma-70 family RNA polymerase sigma factor [Armatimonadota bacterium]
MTQAADDAVLISQAQAGDRAAFDVLVGRYEARAYQYAFRLTRNPEIASDIVSDAFLRVYTALNNFRGQSAFGTWLYRIITNCYLDFKKRDKSARNTSLDAGIRGEEGEIERQFEDPSDGPEVLAERNAREGAVQGALAQMPEQQQAMLVMFHVEMRSYEEIAQVLDVPLGTVKSRLNRARLALRDLLGNQKELFFTG